MRVLEKNYSFNFIKKETVTSHFIFQLPKLHQILALIRQTFFRGSTVSKFYETNK